MISEIYKKYDCMRMKCLVFAISLVTLFAFVSCDGIGEKSATATDSVSVEDNMSIEYEICGITVDRAMNSIVVADENGDTLSFGYAEVEDRTNYQPSLIGDSVTVKYVTLNSGEDSVTAIIQCLKSE